MGFWQCWLTTVVHLQEVARKSYEGSSGSKGGHMRIGGSNRKYLAFLALSAGQSAALLMPGLANAQNVPTATGDRQNTESQSSTPEADLRGQREARFNFKIAAGGLQKVLDDISAQSGSKYRAATGGIPDVQSPGVTGYMTLHEAVVRALIGTDVRVVSVR